MFEGHDRLWAVISHAGEQIGQLSGWGWVGFGICMIPALIGLLTSGYGIMTMFKDSGSSGTWADGLGQAIQGLIAAAGLAVGAVMALGSAVLVLFFYGG